METGFNLYIILPYVVLSIVLIFTLFYVRFYYYKEFAERKRGARFKHLKTGGIYRIITEGNEENSGDDVIVYRSEKDGSVWVRPKSEFFDGRFERVVGLYPEAGWPRLPEPSYIPPSPQRRGSNQKPTYKKPPAPPNPPSAM